ncbi:MAG: TRAP transporter large permease subunit [Klebsiella michiganensis]
MQTSLTQWRSSGFTGIPRINSSLMLIFIIIGGIIAGVFTPTEASAIAVIYVSPGDDLPKSLLRSSMIFCWIR